MYFFQNVANSPNTELMYRHSQNICVIVSASLLQNTHIWIYVFNLEKIRLRCQYSIINPVLSHCNIASLVTWNASSPIMVNINVEYMFQFWFFFWSVLELEIKIYYKFSCKFFSDKIIFKYSGIMGLWMGFHFKEIQN